MVRQCKNAVMAPSFDEWATSVQLPDDLVLNAAGDLALGAIEFLREIFDGQGAVSSAELLRACQERQIRLARWGIELFMADVRRTTDLPNRRLELRWQDDVLVASYEGSYNAPALQSIREPEAICEIAENLRDEVVEDLWAAWPVCRAHHVGLYAEPVDGRAVWYCRAGRHVTESVGELHQQARR
jgi:hypothetical protein